MSTTPNKDDYVDYSKFANLDWQEFNTVTLEMMAEIIGFEIENRKPFSPHPIFNDVFNSFPAIYGGKGGN